MTVRNRKFDVLTGFILNPNDLYRRIKWHDYYESPTIYIQLNKKTYNILKTLAKHVKNVLLKTRKYIFQVLKKLKKVQSL